MRPVNPTWWKPSRKPRGIGDLVASILAPFGGDAFKRWCAKRGKPCGCSKRQAKLNKLFPMKTITSFLFLCAAIASGQTIISTNLLPLTYVNGTNNGYVYTATNILIPQQRIVLHHLGITNANALGRSNIIARLQVSIDASNTNWVTLQTIYPTVTNAISDSVITSFGRVSLPMRVQIVTTNALGVAVYRQEVGP